MSAPESPDSPEEDAPAESAVAGAVGLSSAEFSASEEPGGPIRRIDDLSLTSLFLKLYSHAGGSARHLSDATGFVVRFGARYYLITNWHVLAGRHPETLQPLSPTSALPDQVRIAHQVRSATDRIVWRFIREPLLNDDGSPRWIAHERGETVDVAALRLTRLDSEILLHPLNIALEHTDLLLYPSMPVSVIGFPGGLRPNVFLGIWKTGHIATDPEIPYKGLPAFLIDATTRGGMSGSIVVARQAGSHLTTQGLKLGVGTATKFLGIYASRLPKDVEIGCVWRPSAIREVLTHAAIK